MESTVPVTRLKRVLCMHGWPIGVTGTLMGGLGLISFAVVVSEAEAKRLS